MSRFLDGISTIISIFHKYAKADGDCSNLSQRKMQELIQKEFADVIAKPRDPQTIDKILQFLEWDGDGHIDFNEFLLLVFRVAKACYWFQPKGPYLQQRTKLTSSGKLHQEPEIKNRGRDRQLQKEEEQTCESNHHPPCEPELQQDIRVNELEILEETVSYQQCNTQSVNDAKQSSEQREPIPQVYEEQSQEPCDQRNRQRRRQPPAPNRRGDVQVHKHRSLESHEHRLQRDERKYQEGPQQDQLADIRSHSQTCETRPLQNRWGSRQPNEPVGPAKDDRNQRPQEADRGSDNRPRKPELLTEERSRYHLHELEQRALEESSHKLREPESLDLRGPHQSYIKEPLEIDLRYCNTCELERHIDEQRNNEEHNIEYVKRESEKHKMKKWEKRDDARRKGKAQERRVDIQRELDLKVYEDRSHQTREKEEQAAKTNQRERRERRDFVARATEINGRRPRHLGKPERTQETDVVTAEADVKIHRVSWKREPREEIERREHDLEHFHAEEERNYLERQREKTLQERRLECQREQDLEVIDRHHHQACEREERGATNNQRERSKRRDLEAREAEIDGRRQCEQLRLERTREADVVAAEADVKIHHVSRELEPRKEVERRERDLDRLDAEEERRIYLEREREEPFRERRLARQRELDLDVIERRCRQPREREQRGTITNQRERRERRDFEAREAEIDGRRQRDLVRLERTREADVVAAEADVKIHRVSRELEPREEVERRERDLERFDAEEERRVFQEREIEEPTRESRGKHQRELDLEVYEERSRQTREWQERAARTNQRERCERRDFEAREAEIDGRRHHEMLRIERTQEANIVAAEADVKIHRMSRELEPRKEVERRERDLERFDAEEERRLYLEKEREEPLRERRLEQQRELDLEVIECRRRQAREREQRGTMTNQRERHERRDFEARETEIDGRRQRDLVRLERTREADVVAAEADVKIHHVFRELEPRKELERRERDLERLDVEEERKVYHEREVEEAAQERRLKRQREQDLVRLERTREADVVAAEADVKIHRVSQELEPREETERRERDLGCPDAEEERRLYLEGEREEPLRERRLARQRELDLEVIERRHRQAREREQRGANANQRERRERRDFEAREAEIDGRRHRELLRLERTREADVVAAEADVKIHHVSRELEPREEVERREHDFERFDAEEERRVFQEREIEGPTRESRVKHQRELDLEVYEERSRQTREWQERAARTNQRERCERRDFEAREAEIDGRRHHEMLRIERTQEADIVAAEADVKIHRMSRELEPREEVERREREFGHLDAEEERRVYLEKEREEPLRERRLARQRELDLDVIERRCRQPREREQRGTITNQRERRERRDFEAREAEIDGRRQRDLVRLERTREADVVAAEADVKIHRVFRELEPRKELERRERDLERLDVEEERRVYHEREVEEAAQERRLERQREQDLVRLERTREADVVAAEADVKIHRVSQELELREETERRERDLGCPDAEEERRLYLEGEREEPLRERRLARQRELDLEVYEERSRQTREWQERAARTNQRERCERRDFEAREAEIDGRRQREMLRIERTQEADIVAAEADVKIHHVSRELEPREEVERRERDLERFDAEEERRIYVERGRDEPLLERRIERKRELDVDVIERCRRQAREREERGTTTNQRERSKRRDFEAREAEIDGRRQRDLVRLERTREADVVAAEADVKIHRVSRELEPREEVERRERDLGCPDAEERRLYLEREREEPLRERKLEQQRELDLEVIERRHRQPREREQRGANANQRERRERRDFEAREAEIDGRRHRELLRLERKREADVVAAEADVKIHHVSRELEPRKEVERRERDLDRLDAEEERRIYLEREREEPFRERRLARQRELDLEVIERSRHQVHEREERGANANQRDRRDFEARAAVINRRRQRDLERFEMTQEAEVAAAEANVVVADADVKIHRVAQELEPREEVERRERDLERFDAEEERRVFQEREIEGPTRESRVKHQRELDLEVYEERSRQTREWQERAARTNQRERCERRDFEAREAEIDGRRHHEMLRIERTQEADIVAAEADVKIHRMSRELEPREEVERREREFGHLDAEEERRVYLEKEREEPLRERRLARQRELDLDVIERRCRQPREREQRGTMTNQRERHERRDFEACEAEIDGRRQRDLVRLERTREADVVAAEADVKIHRVSRELEPLEEVERRERDLERFDAEEERRVFQEREIEEPTRESRGKHQRELDLEVYEERSRQTHEWQERAARTNQRERCERRDFEAHEAEIDGRRHHEMLRIERTQEADIVAAEADVKIHRMSRELEPRKEVERRERDLERFDAEEERRLYLEKEREEPLRERRLEQQRELDLEVIECRRRQAREREQRGTMTNQRERRERRDFEARETEIDGRRQRDLVRLERTQEADVVAAEADVKIHRVFRELEPRKELERRERDLERLDVEEERRVYHEREVKEAAQERRLERQREQDLVRLERTREADVVAAEADVKIHRVSQELEPREETERRERDLGCPDAEEERRLYLEGEREEPLRERRLARQRELDLEVIERRHRQAREREQRGANANQRERRDFEAREVEIDGRRHRELLRLERTREADVVAAEADVKIHHVSRELEPREEVERRERDLERFDAEEERRIYVERGRDEPLLERRIERKRELDVDVIERCRRQAREREERGATNNQRERSKRRDFEAREAEIDGRRQRDLVRLERTREADVVAAEADVKIHRVSWELEPRKEVERRERDLEHFDAEEERRLYLEKEREEPLRERELERQRELDLEVIERRCRQAREREVRGATNNQRERRKRRDFEAREAEIDVRRQREQLRLERTREADVVAAEADVKIHHVSRLREPRVDVERREREFDHLDAEEERRLYLEKEREEPLRERRLEQQRELDLEVIERRRRQAREREEQGVNANQRERRDFEAREAEIDGRRQCELLSLERTREADVVAADADVKIHRVSQELEPREEVERRERDLEHFDAEEERRVFQEREIEEPTRESRGKHQRELDLEVYEERSRQTRELQERAARTNQRERCERRDFKAHEAEIDGRRQRELLRLERTREADVVAAEADVKIHRVFRELEPRKEVERRERDLERFDAEEERRIYLERERDEPLRERRLERQRELDLEVTERCRRQACERKERGATNNQRERCDFEAREAEIDGRRQRELLRLKRTREANVAAAEADVKIHRVSRELEPRKEVERRERDLDRLDAEEERRICLEREREEPFRERRLARQRELDLEVIEHHRRQVHEREERGATTNQRERRDFEAMPAEPGALTLIGGFELSRSG